jgi:hypothetical protein
MGNAMLKKLVHSKGGAKGKGANGVTSTDGAGRNGSLKRGPPLLVENDGSKSRRNQKDGGGKRNLSKSGTVREDDLEGNSVDYDGQEYMKHRRNAEINAFEKNNSESQERLMIAEKGLPSNRKKGRTT